MFKSHQIVNCHVQPRGHLRGLINVSFKGLALSQLQLRGMCVISFSSDIDLDFDRDNNGKIPRSCLSFFLTRRTCASSCTPPCGSSGRTAASPSRTCRSSTEEDGRKEGFAVDNFENVHFREMASQQNFTPQMHLTYILS